MPKNVVQTARGAILDMTDCHKTGEELKAQILQDVKDTQIFAGRNLPDKMIITETQFKSIEDDLERMHETEDRMYVTPMNVMEVQIES